MIKEDKDFEIYISTIVVKVLPFSCIWVGRGVS
jgi:hypothetical protein